MGMTTLYIDRKDIELDVSNGVIEIREPTGRRGTVPLARLERVVLRGRAKVSTSALGAITDAGAGILVLSGRQNRRPRNMRWGGPTTMFCDGWANSTAYQDPAQEPNGP